MYMTLSTGAVCRLSDNAVIPADPLNGDYAEFLAWAGLGNMPAKRLGDTNAALIAAIEMRLTEIDQLSVRPLRAIVAGAAQQEDRSLLAELNAKAASLRAEVESLTSEISE